MNIYKRSLHLILNTTSLLQVCPG